MTNDSIFMGLTVRFHKSMGGFFMGGVIRVYQVEHSSFFRVSAQHVWRQWRISGTRWRIC